MSEATTPLPPILIHRTTAEVRATAIDAMVRSFLAEMNIREMVAGAFDDCPDVVDLSNLSANANLAGRIYQTRGGPESLRWFWSMTNGPMTRSDRVATRRSSSRAGWGQRSIRTHARLAEVHEPGGARCEARQKRIGVADVVYRN